MLCATKRSCLELKVWAKPCPVRLSLCTLESLLAADVVTPCSAASAAVHVCVQPFGVMSGYFRVFVRQMRGRGRARAREREMDPCVCVCVCV
jgi:hypothetical protein